MLGPRSSVSASSLASWELLDSLRLNMFGPRVGRRPDSRGEAGCVIRWGQGWFKEIRDSLGWRLCRNDHEAVDERVAVLKKLVVPQVSRVQAAMDAQLALQDS